jgi:uncharacterized membrane protein YuzA (DUF378 family)
VSDYATGDFVGVNVGDLVGTLVGGVGAVVFAITWYGLLVGLPGAACITNIVTTNKDTQKTTLRAKEYVADILSI